jgi:hypothetical protein
VFFFLSFVYGPAHWMWNRPSKMPNIVYIPAHFSQHMQNSVDKTDRSTMPMQMGS